MLVKKIKIQEGRSRKKIIYPERYEKNILIL